MFAVEKNIPENQEEISEEGTEEITSSTDEEDVVAESEESEFAVEPEEDQKIYTSSGSLDAIQKTVEEWLSEELPPMPWQETLPDNHPRKRIRTFLHRLFNFIGFPLPPEWPNIPVQEYSFYIRTLDRNLHNLYHYVEAQNKFHIDERLMPRYLGESVAYLARLDWEYPEDTHAATSEMFDLLDNRPPAIIEYDQLYCTPDTSERRANRVREEFSSESAEVLFVGDDDLVSVSLASDFPGKIHMMDLDDRLHEYIGERAPSVQKHKADFIFSGAPRELKGKFDAIMLDPPWDLYRMSCFLDKAIYCLKEDAHARIFLSFCPVVLEHRERKYTKFLQRLAKRCMIFESIQPAFNIYDLSPEVLPDFQARLDKHMPEVDSQLLKFIRHLPYAHSHLYVLRRLEHVRPNFFQRLFFDWWNRK